VDASKLRLTLGLLLIITFLVINFAGYHLIQPAKTVQVTETVQEKRQRFFLWRVFQFVFEDGYFITVPLNIYGQYNVGDNYTYTKVIPLP